MQISRMVLVYDVKFSQLGRKKLAVRFNLIVIKMAAAPKTPAAGREEIGEILRGRGIDIRHGAPRKFRACLQN
jgi:hypothetical protein